MHVIKKYYKSNLTTFAELYDKIELFLERRSSGQYRKQSSRVITTIRQCMSKSQIITPNPWKIEERKFVLKYHVFLFISLKAI